MDLTAFKNKDFVEALDIFFSNLNIPVNKLSDSPADPDEILVETYKPHVEAHQLMKDVYLFGMVDEASFRGEKSIAIKKITEDYEGILVFGVTLKERHKGLLPSRSQLAEITRSFNREFKYVPVVVIFKYNGNIAFANCERLKYLQSWREGEKAGLVSILMDINIDKPHPGHDKILKSLAVDFIRSYDKKNKVESFSDLYRAWLKVYRTEILCEQFYKDYQALSVKLIRAIHPKQVKNKLIAHQGVLNLLNRIMFIYFVQKKEWIMKDENFIFHFWNAYKDSGKKDLFHDEWLNSVFFAAFNGIAYKSPKAIKALPEPYKSELVNFPFLNGGLFAKNDDHDDFILADKHFEDIFDFFESYIFTISEDTPYEVNLEISPSLLGKMYEGMVNATDLDDVDAEHGIVYTEPPEINFMVRRSFVEVLDKKLNGSLSRDFLYHFVFDTPAQKKEILKNYKVDTKDLRIIIASITSCDPACGSGSMLLGVLQVQMELLRVIDEYDNNKHSSRDDFNIKKQLISECIYGVDIKEWAVRIAELRLWLYMIAEAEFEKDDLTKSPLLPNLDFKLRKGNSLLQKFGSLDFTIEDLLKDRNKSSGAARKLNDYIKKKKNFILNQTESGTTYKKLKAEEFSVFNQFIGELIIEKQQKIHSFGVQMGKQTNMFGFEKPEQKNVFETQIDALKAEIDQLRKLKDSIHKEGQLPFSYDIDFMEIFLTRDDPGFDLIIGNPPYVSFEYILPSEDPKMLEYWLKPENKNEKAIANREFKEDLNNKVYSTYPFLKTTLKTPINGKDKTIPVYGNKVPGRSDLYAYFQLLCPALLNGKGTFCFIISNSWLDTESGAFVQQFLLKHTQLYAVYDCNIRSFEAAINTVIYIHSALTNASTNREVFYKTLQPVDNIVRFVMNKIDFTHASYATLLLEQEHASTNTFKELYRLIPLSQSKLFEAGWDDSEKCYSGDNWGSKYFKAPEIFWQVVSKAENKLTSINDIGHVEGYIHGDNIGDQFNKTYFIDSISKTKKILLTKQTDGVIREGVNNSGNSRVVADILFPRLFGDKHIVLINDEDILGQKFYKIILNDKSYKYSLGFYLNSSFVMLQREIFGLNTFGLGGLAFNSKQISRYFLVLKNFQIKLKKKSLLSREINDILMELGFNRNEPIREQQPKPLPDRKELDDIIFDELGLTLDDRREIYWSVAELVKQRLDKASSR